jgi:hypothetical protein
MNNTIHISAQTFENYGSSENPHWKPKGEQKFSLKADSDYFFYGEDNCVCAINKLLAKHSNEMMRFEYRSHEIVFHDIIELDSELFYEEYDRLVESLQS